MLGVVALFETSINPMDEKAKSKLDLQYNKLKLDTYVMTSSSWTQARA